jgi:hypothetical protein
MNCAVLVSSYALTTVMLLFVSLEIGVQQYISESHFFLGFLFDLLQAKPPILHQYPTGWWAPGGFLLFYEATHLLPAILWGLDESAWATYDVRDYARWLSVDSWKQRLRSCGFTCVSILRCVVYASVPLLAAPSKS